MPGSSSRRFPEIDLVKGFAILAVVCIHAKVFDGSRLHQYVLNRAVPVFLVLFGMTSETWWRRAEARSAAARDRGATEPAPVLRWYRQRLGRLLPAVWLMVIPWWLVAIESRRASLRLHWPEALVSFAGYSPWIGPSWFVTLVLELVILFPALRWALDRRTAWEWLPIAAFTSALCVWRMWSIIAVSRVLLRGEVPEPGWFYLWIFAPRVTWHVTAGVFLARSDWRTRWQVACGAAALIVAEPLLADFVRGGPDGPFVGPLRAEIVQTLFDVPLAIALLGLFQRVRLPGPAARFLSWCGAASWGLYLGHVLVHEVVHLRGYEPETGSAGVRVAYALVLFALGALLTAAGGGVRRAVLDTTRSLRPGRAT